MHSLAPALSFTASPCPSFAALLPCPLIPTPPPLPSRSQRLDAGVHRSQGLLLLLTKRALTRASTLLEIYWALRRDIPVIPLPFGDGQVRKKRRTPSGGLPMTS